MRQLGRFCATLVRHALFIIRNYAISLMPVVGFAAFVVWNGGIVVGECARYVLRRRLIYFRCSVGHREHHQPVLHVAQVPYCFCVCAALFGPSLLAPGMGYSKFCRVHFRFGGRDRA
jgi:hypothetical protein